MVSSRLPRNLGPNRVARAIAAAASRSAPTIDMTVSNPTRVGLAYPADLLACLADPRGLAYEPVPFGMTEARAAVASDFRRRGAEVAADRIVLTSSTSEAYSLLFKLLCNAGDEVLVPAPSYPLFDHLAALDAVVPVPYRLEYHGTWRVDIDSVRRAMTPRTRAVLVVSPNNPTGSWLHGEDLAGLVDACRTAGAALIGDEVFADYDVEGNTARASVLDQDAVLTFALGGLSKSAGLPQVKLGWIAAGGPSDTVATALAGLEVVADTYLSVSTPVQLAAPVLIERGAEVRRAILDRVVRNLSALRRAAAGAPEVTVLPVEAGWSAIVQVPAYRSEETLVVDLIEADGVIVHPGYFFDMPREAFVIVSLLPAPESFDAGIARLLARAVSPEVRG